MPLSGHGIFAGGAGNLSAAAGLATSELLFAVIPGNYAIFGWGLHRLKLPPMFLSIATTHRPATDLGFPPSQTSRGVHETELGFGKAIVFYPEATEVRCEAALVPDVDPVVLVRGKGGRVAGSIR